jgi:hypothetical protein
MMEVEDSCDEEMLDSGDPLEAEKEEMKRLDSGFEEKAERLAHIMKIHKEGGMLTGVNLGNDIRSKEMIGRESRAKKAKYVIAEKASTKVSDKNVRILDKAQALKAKPFHELGINHNPFSILSSYNSEHFISVAHSCGLVLVDDNVAELKVLSTMKAEERAMATLSETKARIEREE